MKLIPIALLLSVGVVASALAQSSEGPFTVMESGRRYATLSAAVDAVGARAATILIAPGTYHQCAVQEGGAITYRARQAGTAILDGRTCEGKAALVLRGRSARVEGLVFQNLRVPDGNGAGIRLERGNLDIVGSVFRNSEEGLLTHDDPGSAVRIDQSVFQHLGRCDRDLDCAHSIYVGNYGSLTVTRSRFERGDGGHYVKSRTPQVTITDNSFDDRAGRQTNYMIDLSNGASGTIARNVMVQGRDKDNWSAFITIAPEGREHDSSGLVIADNSASFAPGVSRQSSFVANWTGDRVAMGKNRLGAGLRAWDRR